MKDYKYFIAMFQGEAAGLVLVSKISEGRLMKSSMARLRNQVKTRLNYKELIISGANLKDSDFIVYPFYFDNIINCIKYCQESGYTLANQDSNIREIWSALIISKTSGFPSFLKEHALNFLSKLKQ